MTEHISKSASAKFAQAVNLSLQEWSGSGKVFRVADVIRTARYPDGLPVGKNTIYAKNRKNNYVHERLLSKVKAAAAKSANQVGSQSRERGGAGAAVVSLENAMGRQILQQEEQILQLESALVGSSHRLQHAQVQALIALEAINFLASGQLLEIVRQIRALESAITEKRATDIKREGRALARRVGKLA